MKYILAVSALVLGFIVILIYLIAPSKGTIELKDYIQQAKKEGKAEKIYVYVEDLQTGESVGVNEDRAVFAASLRKVATLLSFLKTAETNKSIILEQEIIFTQKVKDSISKVTEGNEEYPPLKNHLVVGKKYKVNTLLERMILYSDNDAGALLIQAFPEINAASENLVISLEIGKPHNANFFSVKNTTKMFSMLYNRSYLNEEMSEKALKLLIDSEYKKGLVAGIPGEVKVAHKYGNFTYNSPTGNKAVISDCGLVFSENPYTICVVASGVDMDISKPEEVIKDISAIIYNNSSI